MQERVAEGYGFNATENVKILNDDVILKNVWVWLKCIPISNVYNYST